MNILLFLILIFGNFFFIPNAKALEDFICPESFVCDEEIMPEVEFWARVYGEVDQNHALVYNYATREVYETFDVGAECEKNSALASAEKLRVAKKQGLDEDNLRYKCGLKDDFLAGLPMYKEYQPYISKSLEKNKLPLAIQYLPFSESGYNPFRISSAKAVGTWQLMPDVARNQGLHVDKTTYPTIDERRDPLKSTDAAMQYFNDAFECINGVACKAGFDPFDPMIGPLVMTSYIYGIAGTKNAAETIGINFVDIRNNFKGKSFGTYSKNYYPKFLAVYHVATHEVDYFGDISEPKEKSGTYVLSTQKSIKAKPLISSYSLDINEMKYLSNNYKYTDLVWDGKKSIPANNTFEVPLVDDPSSLNKYGKLLATNVPVRRENINIQPITPRPIQPISPPQQELKPARPNLVPLPESQAQKTWINTVLQKLFK